MPDIQGVIEPQRLSVKSAAFAARKGKNPKSLPEVL